MSHSAEPFSGSLGSNGYGVADSSSNLEVLSRRLSEKQPSTPKLVVDDDFDLETLLRNFLALAEEQNIQLHSLGLSFQDLSVYGKDERYSYLPTIGDVLKGPYTLYQWSRDSRHSKDRTILNLFSGLVNSGEMLLVLGRPGAGCSTLLRALSGTERAMYTGITGTVNYDGLSQKELLKRFPAELIYNPELDVHFPHLTVKQTLDFALACKVPGTRINNQTVQEYIDFTRDMLATVFGLRHTYNTKVGNDYIRGVSGGERKRVSIAEAMACEGSLYCWDNATRGLDASTALEYARAIRLTTNLLRKTAIVTIYQAGENVYDTFDKVTVLYLGMQVYFGPVDKAKAYFEKMGYECPPRQPTAEFLTAVTDPNGRKPFKGMENQVPRTAGQFREYWLHSPEYAALLLEIDEYNKSHSSEAKKDEVLLVMKQQRGRSQRLQSHYVTNYYQQIKTCCTRSYQNLLNDKTYTVIQISTVVIQALVVGSVFYGSDESVDGAFSRSGVMYTATLFMSIIAMAEMSKTFTVRPVLMKQRNYRFYHPSAHALAESVCIIPIAFLINIIFALILYFLGSLERVAWKFFVFLLFQYVVFLSMNYLFQAIAAWSKDVTWANTMASCFILVCDVYSSYMIRPPSMHPWFMWLSYLNPVKYSFESMLTTEFHNRNMTCSADHIVPRGDGYTSSNVVCDFVGSLEGQTWVDGDRYVALSYEYSFSHVWRNLGILIGFMCFSLFMSCLGYELTRPVSGGIDRLFFLRGARGTSLRPEDLQAKDEESVVHESEGLDEKGSISPNQTEKRGEVFSGLGTNDTFVWRNIDYLIPYDGSQRKLIDSVSGFCLPGLLTALMGESGAGKTTLLNVLSQRADVGVVTGDMLVNGNRLDASFTRRTGYVQQQDIHSPKTTVREALQFSARLRQPRHVPDEEKQQYVEKIITILNMEEYADAIVGTPGSGLNVEQRKKLTIGTELVAKPSLLLFLDEPTSGLDSQSSTAIVQVLKDLARAGQAIMCTIHQPSATLFEEFERLLLLRKGGQTVYFGNIGDNSREVLDYFEGNGGRICESHENAAEYILEVIGAGATAVSSQDWFLVWEASEQKKAVMAEVDRIISAKKPESDLDVLKDLYSKQPTSSLYQLNLVARRLATTFWRKPDYFLAKTSMMTINGLFIGFSYYGLTGDLAGMQNGLFCAYTTTVVSYPLIMQIQAQAMPERDIYEGRERMCNTYSWWNLVISQFLNEIPYTFFSAVLMAVSVFFPTKVDTSASHAGVFILTYVIFLQLFNITFALLLVYFTPNLESASIIVSFFYMFIYIFAGVLRPQNLMPKFWRFMYRLSPFTYVIQNSVSTMIHQKPVTCSASELSYVTPPSGQTCQEYMGAFLREATGYIINPNDTSSCGYCAYSVADEYFATFGIKYTYVWRNMGLLCAFAVFNLCAGMALYKLVRLTTYRIPLFCKRKDA